MGDAAPAQFEVVDYDPVTGKTVGWVPVSDSPEDQWHRHALRAGTFQNGTYELVGPKVNGNKDGFVEHILVPHGQVHVSTAPRTFDGLKSWLVAATIEGLVWWHPDGRMAKIKRRDFGLKW